MTEHTGGMLALVPDNASQLAVEGGEDPGDLHLTLLYLGDDVTGWPQGQAERLRELMTASAPALDPVQARVIGHAVFNPDGGPDGDRDPCAVYLVGETPDLDPLRKWAQWVMTAHDEYASPPEQHTPVIYHVTAGYGLGVDALSYTGPVRFGTLRLALANDVLDLSLGEQKTPTPAQTKTITFTPPQEIRDYAHRELVWRDDPRATAVIEGKALDGDGLVWVAEHCGEAGKAWAGEMLQRHEVKSVSPDPRAARLREYWAHGPGRKKWRNFRSLRRQLAKHVRSRPILNGLTANIFKLAEGIYPGQRPHGGRKSVAWEWVEVKDATALSDDGLYDGVDDWGAVFADEDVSDYAGDLVGDEECRDEGDCVAETKRLAALGARMVADDSSLFEGGGVG